MRLGVELQVAGDRLRFRPRALVTPELRAEIVKHKLELMFLVSPDTAPPYDCIRCRRPVVLVPDGAMWHYRCTCGNRSKVAVCDYEKLRAFDVALKQMQTE